jgi:hypothetical protein
MIIQLKIGKQHEVRIQIEVRLFALIFAVTLIRSVLTVLGVIH